MSIPKSQPIRVGSLCTGYGGLEIGFTQAFGETRIHWVSETDPDTKPILDAHYPGVPNLGDITTTDWSSVEPVDAILAGIPCQAVSSAGRMQADADPRWLWTSGARPAIAALRPRLVVFENVRNLTSIHKGRMWNGILDDFRTLGYTVVWTVLGACHSTVQGCHHRHRIFALATNRFAAPTVRQITGRACGVPPKTPTLPSPRAVDAIRGPASAARAGTRLNGPDLPQVLVNLLPHGHSDPWGRYTWAIRRWERRHGPAPIPIEPGTRGGQRIRPAFTEWMMGLPAGHVTDHADRVPALRIIGNGAMPQQAAAALGILSAELGVTDSPERTDSP